jgi:hypothetical protein
MLPDKALQGLTDSFFANMLIRIATVHFLFQIIGRSRGPETDGRHIFLVVVLKLLGPLAGRPYADKKHPGGKRIKGTGVAKLEILFAEVLDGRVLELADNIGGSPPPGLVHGKDNPGGIIGDIVAESHQSGIFSILRS